MMRKLKILFSLAAVTLILNWSILPIKAEGEDKDSNLSSSNSGETASDSSNANRSKDAPPAELQKKARDILSVKNEEELNKVADVILASLKSYREVEGAKEEDLEKIRKMKLDMLKASNPSEEQRKALMKTIAKFDNAILKASPSK